MPNYIEGTFFNHIYVYKIANKETEMWQLGFPEKMDSMYLELYIRFEGKKIKENITFNKRRAHTHTHYAGRSLSCIEGNF